MISLRARLTRALLRLRVRLRKPDAPMPERRARLDRLGGAISAADGVDVDREEVGGRYAEWLVPLRAAEDEVILYLHGGAYTAGSCASHRNAVSHIVRAAGMRLLMPEYRLAPEHPFPAALDDGLTAYRWLLERGVPARKVILAGDSAGGGLALAVMLAARDEGLPLPGAASLISAWTDLAATGGSLKSRNDKDPWFDAEDIAPMARNYHQDTDPRHPLVSPLYASLAGLPPLMLQVGDHEVLLNDTTRLAEKAREAGVDVTLRVWPGMWHVWHFFVGRMPEAKQAILEMAAFIEARMAVARRAAGDR
ncbi:MAG TPA: alpha/beta hydrolase [Woeseiaceae bacterium]|nr:alpha/beta hydrolase [Woeseiaceae bacterium]